MASRGGGKADGGDLWAGQPAPVRRVTVQPAHSTWRKHERESKAKAAAEEAAQRAQAEAEEQQIRELQQQLRDMDAQQSGRSNPDAAAGAGPGDAAGHQMRPAPPSELPADPQFDAAEAKAKRESTRTHTRGYEPTAADIAAQQQKDDGFVHAVQSLDLMALGLHPDSPATSAGLRDGAPRNDFSAPVTKPSYRGRVVRDIAAANAAATAPGRLSAAAAVALFSLHAKQPAVWTPQALAQRYALPAEVVDTLLRCCAAPYVHFDAQHDVYVGTPQPVDPTMGGPADVARKPEGGIKLPGTLHAVAAHDALGGETVTYADYLPYAKPPTHMGR